MANIAIIGRPEPSPQKNLIKGVCDNHHGDQGHQARPN